VKGYKPVPDPEEHRERKEINPDQPAPSEGPKKGRAQPQSQGKEEEGRKPDEVRLGILEDPDSRVIGDGILKNPPGVPGPEMMERGEQGPEAFQTRRDIQGVHRVFLIDDLTVRRCGCSPESRQVRIFVRQDYADGVFLTLLQPLNDPEDWAGASRTEVHDVLTVQFLQNRFHSGNDRAEGMKGGIEEKQDIRDQVPPGSRKPGEVFELEKMQACHRNILRL
jgi:hypothetical protein